MTEDDTQLRQVLRMAHQLPEPDWNLFARTTQRWSKFRPTFHRIETQQKQQMKEAPTPAPTPIPNVLLLEDIKEEKRQKPMSDYETLGLEPNSSLREIRKAYLTLSMAFHPDKGGDPEQFKKIKAAYENLTSK